MVPTGTGNQGKPGKMGRHFPVRKSQGILSRLEKSGNFAQNTGKQENLNKIFFTQNVGKSVDLRK